MEIVVWYYISALFLLFCCLLLRFSPAVHNFHFFFLRRLYLYNFSASFSVTNISFYLTHFFSFSHWHCALSTTTWLRSLPACCWRWCFEIILLLFFTLFLFISMLIRKFISSKRHDSMLKLAQKMFYFSFSVFAINSSLNSSHRVLANSTRSWEILRLTRNLSRDVVCCYFLMFQVSTFLFFLGAEWLWHEGQGVDHDETWRFVPKWAESFVLWKFQV